MEFLNLVDKTFGHSVLGYCSDYQTSDIFKWNRYITSGDVVYTDIALNEVKDNLTGNNYAWLIEPMEVSPQNYLIIDNIKDKFKKVFTHEKTLLDKGSPFEFVSFGCCWVYKDLHEIYKKTKDISMISSSKRSTTGQILRHSVIEHFRDKIDLYGRGFNPIKHKIEGLKDHRFSIVIENCKRDYWFTEKLIDCFVTGTIPIYWGCPSIGDFFNIDGMFIFNTMEELNVILKKIILDPLSEYRIKMEGVKDNFGRSKNYLLPDEVIFKKIKEKTK